ncbi:MAG: ABC transporter permease subunit [Trueperaceae bacterium]|nr:ABC transporter permease subunit [Trueperaceae bacterium]
MSNYAGGFRFTPSYLALLLALVVYTSSFIAEIVRGGIQAVPNGQTEAASALGLSSSQTFSLIVFPQAVRIILPPMISQYLNLTKNSSLGPLAAYGEIFAISTIVANQTGASVPVTLLIIGSYLVISFVFAFVLNIVNARMAIVER